jgi:predicted dehydrogenase
MSINKKHSRRKFIKNTGLGIAGVGLLSTYPVPGTAKPLSPLETVNIGLIGCRNMGFGDLKHHLNLPDTRCIAMCDVDANVLDERTAEIEKTYNQKPEKYSDFRKLLENKDIDAVIIGTPDHWHCLPMIYACQEGKAVYVEKPMANSIAECNLMVKAANKYNAIVQVGQQQRSGKQWHDVMKSLKSGKLGKLRKVEIWANFNYGVGQMKKPDEPIPNGVDYDFWLGPAPLRTTFNATRYHGSWRMFWDYGGGLVTDWGVHLIDMALWAGDVKAAPSSVMSYGKNLSFENYNHETYDTMSVIWPQDDYVMTWEHTAGTQNGPDGMSYGLRFICDDATIFANREQYKIIPEDDSDDIERFAFEEGRQNHDLHAKNFIDCIKNNNRDTACTPETGRQVALYAHMANIAVRSGEGKLEWDNQKNRFSNSKKANAYIVPEYRKPWELPKL